MSSFRRGVGLVKPNARFFVRGRRVCRVVSHAVGCRRVGNLALVGVVEPRTTALAGFALTLGVWGYPYSHVSKLSPLGV